jgi:hypothetical protein
MESATSSAAAARPRRLRLRRAERPARAERGTMRKTKHRGIRRIAADFVLNLIAYNLIRIPKLVAA